MTDVRFNASVRNKLAGEWREDGSISELDQIALRSRRAIQGIKCRICGKVGYYRENCPNYCISPPPTPDSWDSPPSSAGGNKGRKEKKKTGNTFSDDSDNIDSKVDAKDDAEPDEGFGILWGPQKKSTPKKSPKRAKKVSLINTRADLGDLRTMANTEVKRLRDSDRQMVQYSIELAGFGEKEGASSMYQFMDQGKEGYERHYSELTLHQVMRRLMRMVEQEVLKNADKLNDPFDVTLLHPPRAKPRENFYPDELFKKDKEFRDYAILKDSKKKTWKNHQNQAALRPPDQLDSLYRGGAVSQDFIYETNPKAGETMHAKNDFKSVLSYSDQLASSDPTMRKKQEKIDEMFKNQAKWVTLQKNDMGQFNDRFDHLADWLQKEMKKEHERESTELLQDKRSTKQTKMKLYQERLSRVDSLLDVLKAYNFSSGAEEADLLMYQLQKWKGISAGKVVMGGSTQDKVRKKSHMIRSSRADNSHSRGNSRSNSRSSSRAKSREGSGDEGDDEGHQDGDGLRDPSATIKSKNKRGEANVLVTSEANPYYSDVEWLAKQKKKRDRMLASSLRGTKSSLVPAFGTLVPNESATEARTATAAGVATEGIVIVTTEDDAGASRTATPSATALGEAEKAQKEAEREKERAQTMSTALAIAKQEKAELAALAKEKRDKKAIAASGNKSRLKNFSIKQNKHPREVDEENMEKARQMFKAAGLQGNIRKGDENDLACVMPSLIPVPGAFQSDGSNPLSSYTGENIIWQVKKNMILGDLGYTPQSMIPLYARLTLIEKYGTSPGGDQNFEVMAKDRRYTHNGGRPLNRFEPEMSGGKVDDAIASLDKSATLSSQNKAITALVGNKMLSKSLANSGSDSTVGSSQKSPKKMKVVTLKPLVSVASSSLSSSSLADAKLSKSGLEKKRRMHEKAADEERRLQQEREDKKNIRQEMNRVKQSNEPISGSLVRMVFGKAHPDLKDLKYLDDY